jgi:hypothetical protein
VTSIYRVGQRVVFSSSLPIWGAIAIVAGALLECAEALTHSRMLPALGHAVGYWGVVVFLAGVALALLAQRICADVLIGIAIVPIILSPPRFLAPGWLQAHNLSFLGGLGTVVIVFAPIALMGYLAHSFGAADRARRPHPRILFYAWTFVCVAIWGGALWYELWQQPFVEIGPHLPPRGYVEWEQVVADAAGIWLGYFAAFRAWRQARKR